MQDRSGSKKQNKSQPAPIPVIEQEQAHHISHRPAEGGQNDGGHDGENSADGESERQREFESSVAVVAVTVMQVAPGGVGELVERSDRHSTSPGGALSTVYRLSRLQPARELRILSAVRNIDLACAIGVVNYCTEVGDVDEEVCRVDEVDHDDSRGK